MQKKNSGYRRDASPRRLYGTRRIGKMKALFEFLQEDNGGPSAIRLFSFVSVVCMAVDWMHAVFTVGKWSPDPSLIALVLGPITAKVVQKRLEEKPPPPTPPPAGDK